MLRRLFIDNFKCLSNFELRPAGACCLVGANASGKSAVLGALRNLQSVLHGIAVGESTAFPALSRTRWDPRTLQRIELEVVEGGVSIGYELVIRHDQDGRSTVVQREAVSASGQPVYENLEGTIRLYGDDGKATNEFPADARRSFLSILESSKANKTLLAFKAWIARMWLFALRPSEIQGQALAEDLALNTEGLNYAPWYRSLAQERPGALEALRKDAAQFMPGLQNLRFLRFSQDHRVLVADFMAGEKPYILGLEELSEGQRSLLVLHTILHAVAPFASLVFFDEPDNFVARWEIQPWLAAVRTAMEGRGNLLVISHHPEVIDYLAPDQLLFLQRDGEGPTRMRTLEMNRESGIRASERVLDEAFSAG